MATNAAQTENEQYLRLISIFHYVVGGLAGMFACFPIFHLIIGIAMLVMSAAHPDEAGPAAFVGIFFTLFAGTFIAAGWAFAICTILAGRNIARRTRYMYCLVMAGVECMFTPFGTVLGVFTLILLLRPEVKAMFGLASAPAAPAS